jgi:hypothetical protein
LKEKAPNVLAMINAFNEFCTWVAVSILAQERIKDRVKTMEYFVQTAKVPTTHTCCLSSRAPNTYIGEQHAAPVLAQQLQHAGGALGWSSLRVSFSPDLHAS